MGEGMDLYYHLFRSDGSVDTFCGGRFVRHMPRHEIERINREIKHRDRASDE